MTLRSRAATPTFPFKTNHNNARVYIRSVSRHKTLKILLARQLEAKDSILRHWRAASLPLPYPLPTSLVSIASHERFSHHPESSAKHSNSKTKASWTKRGGCVGALLQNGICGLRRSRGIASTRGNGSRVCSGASAVGAYTLGCQCRRCCRRVERRAAERARTKEVIDI